MNATPMIGLQRSTTTILHASEQKGTSCVEQSHRIIWERASSIAITPYRRLLLPGAVASCTLQGNGCSSHLQRKPLEQKPSRNILNLVGLRCKQPAEMFGSSTPL